MRQEKQGRASSERAGPEVPPQRFAHVSLSGLTSAFETFRSILSTCSPPYPECVAPRREGYGPGVVPRDKTRNRKRGTGQIAGESEGKRGWYGHRGCKRSSSEAGQVFREEINSETTRRTRRALKHEGFCEKKGTSTR